MWEANRIGMCLPQLKEARRTRGEGFPPGAVEWLRMRFDADCHRFGLLLGDAPFLHGDAPGIGDCAVWGYAQWLDEAGVAPTPPLQSWLDRMRSLAMMKSATGFFPLHPGPGQA